MKKLNNLSLSVVVVSRNRSGPLARCLKSLKLSRYKISEVIVVDNGSDIPIKKPNYQGVHKLRVIRSDINTGAAAGRNIGARVARSDLIFFLDDDAYIDKDTLSECVNTLRRDHNIAIVQTKVLSSFRKNIILGIGHNVNTTTSLITAYGINEVDLGQYNKEIDIPMVGTGWLIKRNVFNKVKGFDEKFFVPYEDSDLSLRVRNLGYRIVLSPNSRIWHDDLKPTEINSRIRSIGIASPERAYFVGRNKVYFMKKHSKGFGRLIFFAFLLPLFVSYHTIIILSSLRIDILLIYYKGLVSGLFL